MPLKIFVKKKNIINEAVQEKVKRDLDKKKVNSLDNIVTLLGELNTNITNNIIHVNQSKQQTQVIEKDSSFIPSIDTKVSSDKVSSVKKSTKKRF